MVLLGCEELVVEEPKILSHLEVGLSDRSCEMMRDEGPGFPMKDEVAFGTR